MLAGGTPLGAAVMLIGCAAFHEAPGCRTETCADCIGGGMSHELLDDPFDFAIRASVRCDGYEAKVGAGSHPYFQGLNDEVLAVALS